MNDSKRKGKGNKFSIVLNKISYKEIYKINNTCSN